MKSLTTYITEAIATKKELTEFESAWLDWLTSHGKEGHLQPAAKDIQSQMVNFIKKHYGDYIDEFWNDSDYYTYEALYKIYKKNPDVFEFPDEIKSSKSKTLKFIKNMFSEEYWEDIVDSPVIKDKEKFIELTDRYAIDYIFNGLYSGPSFDKKTGLLKVYRSVAIPKEVFKVSNKIDNHQYSYREWIENYFEGLGVYWSYSSGGVYCFQSFDDDELVSTGNMVTLEMYGLVDFDSIDMGSTLRQLSGNFSTEEEITIISEAPVEVYKVVIKDKDGKDMKMPLKKTIVYHA